MQELVNRGLFTVKNVISAKFKICGDENDGTYLLQI